MAKDLQWFKFVISEWITGDIQLVSYAAKGLFTDIMAHYWSKEGDVTLKKLYKHFPVCLNGNQHSEIFQELITEDCVKIDGEHIRISFMDEQSDKWKDLSIIKSEAGSKGGRGVKADTKAPEKQAQKQAESRPKASTKAPEKQAQKQAESRPKASTKADLKQAQSYREEEREREGEKTPSLNSESKQQNSPVPNRQPTTAQTSSSLASGVPSSNPKTIKLRADFLDDIEGYKFKQSEVAEILEEFDRVEDRHIEAGYLQFRRKWKTEEGRKKMPKPKELVDLFYTYAEILDDDNT